MNKWLSKYCCLFASSTVGTVVLALGTVLFYFPFDIVAGGVGGLGIALSLFFGGRLSAAFIVNITVQHSKTALFLDFADYRRFRQVCPPLR